LRRCTLPSMLRSLRRLHAAPARARTAIVHETEERLFKAWRTVDSFPKIREANFVPATLAGDKVLPMKIAVEEKFYQLARKPHIQRKLIQLDLEGHIVSVLTKSMIMKDWQFGGDSVVSTLHFNRWPRHPEKNPVRIRIPLLVTNMDRCPKIKKGGFYVHDYFERGIECKVSDAETLPTHFVADMSRAVNGDLKLSDLDIPPGVVPLFNEHDRMHTGENVLVCRSRRIKNRY